jgi:hypothetical protein
MPGMIKDYIHGYRADPTGQFKGKDRMETLPKEFDKYNMQKYITAMKAGEPLGVKQLSSQQLANMALHEGREDFGFNSIENAVKHSKNAQYVVDNLRKQGLDNDSSLFAGLLYDKQKTADRLNIPFEKVWNGTKKSKEGKTGDDYVKEAKAMEYAAAHPKNAELVDFIDRAVNNQFTPQEDTLNKVRNYEEKYGFGKGVFEKGEMHNPFSNIYKDVNDPNAVKLLKEADFTTLQQILNNKIREAHGIAPMPTDTQFKQGYGMGNDVQAAHLAAELPSVQQFLDNKVQEATKTIGAKTPTVTMPDNFRTGGRTRLI